MIGIVASHYRWRMTPKVFLYVNCRRYIFSSQNFYQSIKYYKILLFVRASSLSVVWNIFNLFEAVYWVSYGTYSICTVEFIECLMEHIQYFYLKILVDGVECFCETNQCVYPRSTPKLHHMLLVKSYSSAVLLEQIPVLLRLANIAKILNRQNIVSVNLPTEYVSMLLERWQKYALISTIGNNFSMGFICALLKSHKVPWRALPTTLGVIHLVHTNIFPKN